MGSKRAAMVRNWASGSCPVSISMVIYPVMAGSFRPCSCAHQVLVRDLDLKIDFEVIRGADRIDEAVFQLQRRSIGEMQQP